MYSDIHGWPCTSDNKIKACLCVGPENCDDKDCPLVAEMKEKENEKV